MMAHWALPSITARVTLMLGVIAVAVFFGVGALLHETLERELIRGEQEDLASKAQIVQHFVDEAGQSQDAYDLHHHLRDALIGHGHIRIWIAGTGEELLFGAGTMPAVQPGNGDLLAVRGENGVALSGRRFPVSGNAVFPAQYAVIAIDTRPRESLMRTYRVALTILCGIGVLTSVGLGAFATRRGLAPLARLSHRAERIKADTLSQRLPVEGVDRELRTLAMSFNGVLDRLERAYEQMEAYNADLAHEMRTPLATMISGAQLALRGDHSPQELRDALASNLEELEQVNSMINDMLFLAQADRGERPPDVESVALRDEAQRVADYFEAALNERSVRLAIEGHATAHGNAALLRRALSNLIGNALEHTERGGTIVVRSSAGAVPVLSVINPGPGIAPADLGRIFDRFFRADRSRDAARQGIGLGLAIVRAIARMHGGETFAESSNGRTEIGFTFGGGKPARVVEEPVGLEAARYELGQGAVEALEASPALVDHRPRDTMPTLPAAPSGRS